MRIRRIIASIIDIVILLFLFAGMISFFPLNDEIKEGYAKIEEIENTTRDRNEINKVSYEMEHEFIKYYLMSSLILICYFIFIPKWRKDQTIGQRIMKVRLVNDNEVTMNAYVIRALLNSGLSLLLMFPLLIYILDRVWYPRATSILIMTQILYWFVSLVMLLISKETIHDKLTKTKIIEVKR